MINDKMRALGAKRSVIREIFEYSKKRKAEIGDEKVFDFSLGNPSVAPPECVSEGLSLLINQTEPTSLHGYTSAEGDLGVRSAISEYISKTQGFSVSPSCLYMTVGAAGALTSALTAITTPGEEVIVLTPYFPEYKIFIERCGAVLREVACRKGDFQLDIDAICNAVNEKTAAIIINSPNNPTGAVYTKDGIAALAEMLSKKGKELSKNIYMIADEPYRELVYGDIEVPYIPKYYDNAIVCYSFSKSLSIPGDRIGYVMVSPLAKDFTAVYQAVCGAGRALGFVCAPSLLQKLLPSCLGCTADISVYAENRKILYEALTEYGYEVVKPDGAFYLFIKALVPDANEFCEEAKKFELLLVPSDDFGCPGYVRLAYCVKTEQVISSLPAFKALAKKYGKV